MGRVPTFPIFIQFNRFLPRIPQFDPTEPFTFDMGFSDSDNPGAFNERNVFAQIQARHANRIISAPFYFLGHSHRHFT